MSRIWNARWLVLVVGAGIVAVTLSSCKRGGGTSAGGGRSSLSVVTLKGASS